MHKKQQQNESLNFKDFVKQILLPTRTKVIAFWIMYRLLWSIILIIWLLFQFGFDFAILRSAHNVLFALYLIPEVLSTPIRWVSQALGALVEVLLILLQNYVMISLVIYILSSKPRPKKSDFDLRSYKENHRMQITMAISLALLVFLWINITPQGQKYDPKIRTEPYCQNALDTPFCICQRGYVKDTQVERGIRNDCFPEVCKNVHGWTLVGDVGMSNVDFCEWAVRDARSDACDTISYTFGREVCELAYVGRTENKTACQHLTYWQLKKECYIDTTVKNI